jgi:hypothetical protein
MVNCEDLGIRIEALVAQLMLMLMLMMTPMLMTAATFL